MKRNNRTITVNDIIKCILLLNMCRTIISNADPKFGDIYLKMCAVLKLPKFCWSYTMMGSYPYPFYTLPLPAPIPLSVAPFPLIVNPTSSSPQYTIPTVFTTNRPPGQGGAPNMGSQGMSPGPSPSAPPQCPPSPQICPPAALAMPFIDPRQGELLFQSLCDQ